MNKYLFLAAVIIADFFTTYAGVNFCGLAEANPFMAPLWYGQRYGQILFLLFMAYAAIYGINEWANKRLDMASARNKRYFYLLYNMPLIGVTGYWLMIVFWNLIALSAL